MLFMCVFVRSLFCLILDMCSLVYIFWGFVLCFRVTGSSSRPSYRDAFTVLIVFVLDRGRDDHGGSAYSLGDAVT